MSGSATSHLASLHSGRWLPIVVVGVVEQLQESLKNLIQLLLLLLHWTMMEKEQMVFYFSWRHLYGPYDGDDGDGDGDDGDVFDLFSRSLMMAMMLISLCC